MYTLRHQDFAYAYITEYVSNDICSMVYSSSYCMQNVYIFLSAYSDCQVKRPTEALFWLR